MQTISAVLLLCVAVGLTVAAPQMFIWNCQDCPYGTRITSADVEFSEGSEASGDLTVRHIVAEDGRNSLEIRGPMSGLTASRAEFRIHSDGDCSSLGEILHAETCKNCQNYVSIKVLDSRKVLTIGGENDVMGKTLSILDARRGAMLGCAEIVPISP